MNDAKLASIILAFTLNPSECPPDALSTPSNQYTSLFLVVLMYIHDTVLCLPVKILKVRKKVTGPWFVY
jgi:hypothetical protein